MSYRCQICNICSEPGTPLLKHIVYREVKRLLVVGGTRQEIAREIPVCSDCHWSLTHGLSLYQLMNSWAYKRGETPVRKVVTPLRPVYLSIPQSDR